MIRTRWEPGKIFDQKETDSCTAHAWAAACRSVWGDDSPTPTELYNAYWDREIKLPRASAHGYARGTGMALGTMARMLKDDRLLTSYQVVDRGYRLERLKQWLEDGPVLLAMPWYRGFTYANQTILELTGELRGYHAVTILDWDTARGPVIQNSHGIRWGNEGRAFLPWRIFEAIMANPTEYGGYLVVPTFTK